MPPANSAVKAVVFNQTVKHGRHEFLPKVAVAFEDPDAAPYFVAAGWAAYTADEPVRVYSKDEIDIDPKTKFAGGGYVIQPHDAKISTKG